MSTRTTYRPKIVLNAGDMSTATLTSEATVLQSLSKLLYTLSWTGSSPIGTVSVQVSNDYSLDATGQVANSGTWSVIELEYQGQPVTSIPVSGNTGTGAINLAELAAYAIRLVYTKASGTGSLTVVASGKVS